MGLNDLMTNNTFLSEEFKVEIVIKTMSTYFVILRGYKAGYSAEELRKCNVCFKMCFRRIFNYGKYEFV